MNPENPFYKYAEYRKGFRDEVYAQAITTAFNRARNSGECALHVIEIGGIRSLAKHSRFSDGWSTMVMLQTALKLGAEVSIDVCDLDNLFGVYSAMFGTGSDAFAREASLSTHGSIFHRKDKDYDWYIQLLKDNGAMFLDVLASAKDVDLFVLDGSDDPRQTKDQFEWARDACPDALILFDDWNIKGSLVKEVYARECPYNFKEHVLPYEYDGIKGVHYMATFDPLTHREGALKLI